MINFNEKNREFHLQGKNFSYVFNVMQNGQLGQLYFGKKIRHREDFSHFFYKPEVGIGIIAHYEEDPGFSLEYFKQEYPSYGTTDFRKPAFEIEDENGSRVSNFVYKGYRIYKGKEKLQGLPATYVLSEEEAETLEITLEDEVLECRLYLTYTIFNERDILTRNARFENYGKQNLKLNRAMSLSLDLPDYNYEMLHFSGAWARERHLKTRKLEVGNQYIDSTRGASSAHQNPFIILKRPNTDEDIGEAIGFSLVYSGNFLAHVEVDHFDATRVTMGINPFDFSWNLNGGESFQTPEAIISFTSTGLNSLSQNFHSLYRERLMRGEWKEKERPILINNWEATYFDFNEEKLLNMVRKAKKLGFELFVLDDGWFGKRNDDKSSLGDWFPNLEKLPNGIKGLAEKVEAEGMKFGLWFEPEMISKESELYKKHPDWILGVKGRKLSLGRNQYILDLSREDVQNYIISVLDERFAEAPISYVKWDMNRNMSEIGSAKLPANRQREVAHRYILGLYKVLEEITTRFPDVLFESCSGGGGRFDPGMLYYMPQTWTSDNTDAIERLKIQFGTSMVYPNASIGCHVSAVPNHQVDRITPIETRGVVAMSGNFGYELDITKLPESEKEIIKEQVKLYKEIRETIQFGKCYRLSSPFENNDIAWMFISKDCEEIIVSFVRTLAKPNSKFISLKLVGLDESSKYEILGENIIVGGDELMNIGLNVPELKGDYQAKMWRLKKVK